MKKILGENGEFFELNDNGRIRSSLGILGQKVGHVFHMDDGRTLHDGFNGHVYEQQESDGAQSVRNSLGVLFFLAMATGVNSGVEHYQRWQIAPVVDRIYAERKIEKTENEKQKCLYAAAKKAFGSSNNIISYNETFEEKSSRFDKKLSEEVKNCGEIDPFTTPAQVARTGYIAKSFYLRKTSTGLTLGNTHP